MSHLHVRRATLQDYQGVLDIGIVYDGMDYLPYFYKEFLTDPDYLCYVCEAGGEIIGYACVLVHDDGKVSQRRAGRIKPSHRGKGYMKSMVQLLNADVAAQTSSESMLSVTPRHTMNLATLTPPLFHIDSPNLYHFTILKSRCTNFTSAAPITRLYKDDIETLFGEPSVCQRLFPRDTVYVSYLALGLHKTNIRHIVNENTKVFATTSTPDKSNTMSDGKFRKKVVGNIRFMTAGLHIQCSETPVCYISAFGDDMETFEAHVQAQITDTLSESNIVKMGVVTSEKCPRESIEHIFRKYGSGKDSDFHCYPQCLVRQVFEPKRLKAKY